MDRTLRHRQQLAGRIFQIVGLVAVVAPACGGSVIADGEGSGGEGGSGGNPPTSTNGPGPATGTGGLGTTTVSTGGYGTTTVGPGGYGPVSSSNGSQVVTSTGSWGECGSQVQCFEWSYDAPCPVGDEAIQYMQQCSQGCWIDYVNWGPEYQGASCCYGVSTSFCGVGRPFVVSGASQVAPLGDVPLVWAESSACPDVSALSPLAREALASAWGADAQLEHASVASFSRFALELLAVGAPSHLLAGAHEAAIDEVRHARLCFTLASAYAGRPISPGPFQFHGAVEVSSDLADIAARAVLEGCVGETLASLQAAEQLAVATDPAVRAVLAQIVEDEARHAELAWRTVAWALETGDARVRRAVAEAFGRASSALPADGPELPTGVAAHGRLSPADVRAAMERALEDVILPCAKALFARRSYDHDTFETA